MKLSLDALLQNCKLRSPCKKGDW